MKVTSLSTDENGRIPVYKPDLAGNERKYVLDCVDSSWISSLGKYIGAFEGAIGTFVGSPNAIAVCNGTVALHLAMHCLDIGPGDEVIVPTFTYIASVNTIAQTGATPVFAECRSSDWQLDPQDVARKITSRTKAIVPVHLYGNACSMAEICALAEASKVFVVEDCAESLGTTIGGKHVGTFGDLGTFSFFGNKTLTTGEGGMVICRDNELAARLRMTKGQGQSLTTRYWHEVLGFNYRMTNIAAAIGLAQAERLPEILLSKRTIAGLYKRLLAELPVTFQSMDSSIDSSYWLVSLLLPKGCDREAIMEHMAVLGVDSRPVFYCAHTMPMYDKGELFPVSEDIASRGISLPSYPTMTDGDVRRVVNALSESLQHQLAHADGY